MRVLLLAPQPFYQERGTPIAIRLALEALAKRLQALKADTPSIDLLTYGEGDDVEIAGVRILRIPTPACLKGVRPGISLKKLVCDLIFALTTFKLLWRSRDPKYDVIHAVEESVFIAWLARQIWGIPYIYDMDSSLALQLTEKWWLLRPLLPIFNWLEGLAVRGSVAVAPVCDALEAIANGHGSSYTVMLRDVSLLPHSSHSEISRSEAFGDSIASEQPVVLYVGNLESYQGIDLLLESFSRIHQHTARPHLVVIGGTPESIDRYRTKAARLGCAASTSFLGPKPLSQLRCYLTKADILVSPRIKGNNTPMKIYSYLHAGRALVATDLPTHRQVLTEDISILAPADPDGFAAALKRLLDDPPLRAAVGERARLKAEDLYTPAAFEAQLHALYEKVQQRISSTIQTTTLSAGEKA